MNRLLDPHKYNFHPKIIASLPVEYFPHKILSMIFLVQHPMLDLPTSAVLTNLFPEVKLETRAFVAALGTRSSQTLFMSELTSWSMLLQIKQDGIRLQETMFRHFQKLLQYFSSFSMNCI